ncbi:Hypothetical_protein [Hexamita inflata]|uniref:Hypothetical_protein n=1 Tax=Hexamita inflata TaxID=28002 RepID=A0AA86UDP1_9EUKA|nr:Hypothetical protein HINF_LOCUS34682 [Hexamita inflata]
MLCMKAPSQRSKVRETVKLPEEGHRERRQVSRVWEQGKKAKPKATLDRTGSEQPSTIEDLEHERVRKGIKYSLILIQISLYKQLYNFSQLTHQILLLGNQDKLQFQRIALFAIISYYYFDNGVKSQIQLLLKFNLVSQVKYQSGYRLIIKLECKFNSYKSINGLRTAIETKLHLSN